MSVECPVCRAVSHHPEDERAGFCGRCHAFTGSCFFPMCSSTPVVVVNGQAVCLEHVDDVFAVIGGTVRAVAEKLRSVLEDALGVLEPRCRDCGETLDGYSALDDDDSVTPDEGMVSLCAYCGCLSVFTGRGLEARPPTGAELALFARDRDVRRAVRAIRSPENPLRRRRRS